MGSPSVCAKKFWDDNASNQSFTAFLGLGGATCCPHQGVVEGDEKGPLRIKFLGGSVRVDHPNGDFLRVEKPNVVVPELHNDVSQDLL